MQEIDAEQLERAINEAQDPDLLKDLMSQAVHLGRDDLVDLILERSIRANRLIDKLQDFELNPATIVYLDDEGDEEGSIFDVEPEAEPAPPARGGDPAAIRFPTGD